MTTRRPLSVRVLLGAIAVLAMLLPAAPAFAHAQLTETYPLDGSNIAVQDAPTEVLLYFNEAVDSPPGGIRVFDEAGDRVDVEGAVPAAEDDPTVAGVRVGALSDGGYIVTYRIVSADGHPLRGAAVFTVGDADDVAASVVADLFGSDDGLAGLLVTADAAVTYITVLLVLGAALVAPSLGLATGRLEALLRRAAMVGLGAAVLVVPLQAMAVSGDGFAAALDGAQLASVLSGSVGTAAVVRAVGLAGVLALRGRGRQAAALVAALSLLVDGHTRTVEPMALMLGADAVHVVAGGIWFGGLVALLLHLRVARHADDPVGGATMVRSWSRWAMGAVVGVTLAGMAMSSRTVGPVTDLSATVAGYTDTLYGQVLSLKLLLAVVLIAMGAYNHWRLVPAVERALVRVPAGGSDTVASEEGEAPELETASDGPQGPATVRSEAGWLRLRRTVRTEIVLMALLLVLTSVMVIQRPAADELGRGGIFQVTEPLVEGVDIDLVVDPNIAGENSIHVYLLDETGRPYSDIEGLTMSFELPDRDIGPIEREPSVSGPGHWVLVGRELTLAGTWQLTVDVRVDTFTEASITVPVVVGAG